nr:CP12 [uncultured Mediterranean phage uvMED]|tara:strand:- start:2070 stop:2297 length:228 start_codon:yes stop_codon:yes gene_type:complete
MENVETHIKIDKDILDNPQTSPQQRRHVEEELHDLEAWVENHKEDIEAGDHHDPSPLELYCDQQPGAPECKIYDN